MMVLDIARKVVLVPIIIVLTLIEFCGKLMTGILVMIVNFVAGFLLLVTVISFLLGVFSGMECLRNAGILFGTVIATNLFAMAAALLGSARERLLGLL